jgi:hypothetical protein
LIANIWCGYTLQRSLQQFLACFVAFKDDDLGVIASGMVLMLG